MKQIISECNSNLEKVILERLKNYEKVTKNFEQFFDQGDLGTLIDRKADIELFRRVQD